ncbi:unnamed protein product [Protopolystoma xenopodis]|uniref:Uncharacterized protein n=1 Tax=Protopolystoma xenopodis TaxID=117903 RepID=A0A448X0I3_9PLAT|nr:unnamed protein product [Protopolystoma xenopodis]
MEDLLKSTKAVAPTVPDPGLQTALTGAARNTQVCLTDLKHCFATAEPILRRDPNALPPPAPTGLLQSSPRVLIGAGNSSNVFGGSIPEVDEELENDNVDTERGAEKSHLAITNLKEKSEGKRGSALAATQLELEEQGKAADSAMIRLTAENRIRELTHELQTGSSRLLPGETVSV